MTKTVTVVGLGAMGLPMAQHLANAFSVRGVDIAEERLALAREAGVECFGSAAEASDGADVVLLGVRNQEQLAQVLFGDAGIADTMKPGAVVLLTSTVGGAAVADAAAVLQAKGLHLVDAPVSGGPTRAGDGTLLVTVGATPEAVDACRDVLEHMSGNLVIVGDEPGKGQAMKTVNQLLCGVHIAAAGEALALADSFGLDLEATLDALMSGAAASFMLDDRGPRMLEAYSEQGPEVRSRLDIFVKDMGIVTDAAREVSLPVPVAAAAQNQYLTGLGLGQDAEDDSTNIRVVNPKKRT